MGYSTRNNGNIKDFWPDDTGEEMYICSSAPLSVILDCINEKWPDADMEDITISAENIHTECLTYDQYDSGDYTDFIKISYVQKT